MYGLFLDHLWQSTLFAAVAALLTLGLRKHPARVRFGLWMAASLKFFVPLALLAALGSHLAWRTSAQVPQPPVMSVLAQPFTSVDSGFHLTAEAVPAATHASRFSPAWLLVLWLCGFLGVAICWLVRWRRVAKAVRGARPAGTGFGEYPVRVLLTDSSTEPGVFGIFRPVLLLPAGITGRLTAEQLGPVIAHEVCHIRRRDNFWACVHMSVQAVFWFHPLIWWMGARLVVERERACDEAVLRQGDNPEKYAECILEVCRYYTISPLPCISGVSGGGLRQRISAIMTYGFVRELSRTTRVGLAALLLVAIAGPVAAGRIYSSSHLAFSHSPQSEAPSQAARPVVVDPAVPLPVAERQPLPPPPEGSASPDSSGTPQAPAQVPAKLPTFDVVSVKVYDGNRPGGPQRNAIGNRWTATHSTLKDLIIFAYGLDLDGQELSGGPSWLNASPATAVRFDIEATAATADVPHDQLLLMVQSLLSDRFHLVAHRETRQISAYAMQVAKGGSKLPPAAGDCVAPGGISPWPPVEGQRPCGGIQKEIFGDQHQVPGWQTGDIVLTGKSITVAFICNYFQAGMRPQFPILDKTGLDGMYDFKLKFNAGIDRVGYDENQARALEEQMGLKLAMSETKQPFAVVVVDDVRMPSPN